MPRERLSMRKIKEVLRLKQTGLSNRAIARVCAIGKETVREYLCQRAWNNNPLWATKNNPLLQERGYQHASRTCIVPSGDVVGRRTNGQG